LLRNVLVAYCLFRIHKDSYVSCAVDEDGLYLGFVEDNKLQ